MPTSYQGEVEVDPSDFRASFKPLVLHGDHASFRIDAEEPDGDDWSVDDQATLEGNSYKSKVVTMHYRSGASCKAQLELRAVPTADGSCDVHVRFEQFEQDEESVWRMQGSLRPFAE